MRRGIETVVTRSVLWLVLRGVFFFNISDVLECWGLGRPEKRRVVRKLVGLHKPLILFIQESKLNHFDNRVISSIDCNWLSRGLGVEDDSVSGLITVRNEDLFSTKACIQNNRCIILTGERVFVVGDGKGWTIIFDYQAWAEGKDFRVGDKLVFNYPGGAHTVLKVNGTGFQNCIKPPASEALTSGSDEIVLATPGRKWYICGVGAHCKTAGQKLFITVQPQSSSVSPAMTPPVQSNMAVKDTVKYQLFLGVMVAVNYHSGLAF
ncbi:hypothetical protein LWI28_002329 [Acer negundo]|uniref:Phytocyanin domain-containing protein n=1 Tax=Acer negundo TaxID=4023 RepID=A0AAD5J2H7_ACENE|nr:hypothetical protein LWI28_002329 [Acer negundo]